MNEQNWQNRTELLAGKENLQKLAGSHILIVGLGGVGGYAAEQLCRAGTGSLTLVDNDIVQLSNINRQIIAFKETEGKRKTEALQERLKQINPEINLTLITEFIDNSNLDVLGGEYDYVIDAIDTLTPKVALLEWCIKQKLNVVSAMGAGGKLDPTKIEITDISKSHHCKLAYNVRKYLHRKGIFKGITTVFSPEEIPDHAIIETNGEGNKRSIVGSISYMPAVFGCYCASVVIRHLISDR